MSQKKCGHCKLVGHNQSNCAKATLDASYFYQRIRDIKEAEASTVKDILSYYLNNLMTVHDLCILMKYVELKLVPFIKRLIEKQKITEQEANFRLKKDRIKVLMWYFRLASKKKLDILAKSFELETDNSSFDCPICVDCKPAKERTVTNCNHTVCKTCIDQYFDHLLKTLNFPKPLCSLCRTCITTITFANTDYIDEVSNKYFKVNVLI
jgi:hypothetical protein